MDHVKNTCHKVVHAWHAPNRIFRDFEKDILGKCDICFRAGFCSLTECNEQKFNEFKMIQHIVETGEFSSKIDEETGKPVYTIDHGGEFSSDIRSKIKENLRHRLHDSVEAEDAHVAVAEVGDIIHTAVSPREFDKKKMKLEKFKRSAEIVSEYIDKAVETLKTLLEEYGKMKDFRTASPVENRKKKDQQKGKTSS